MPESRAHAVAGLIGPGAKRCLALELASSEAAAYAFPPRANTSYNPTNFQLASILSDPRSCGSAAGKLAADLRVGQLCEIPAKTGRP